MECDDVGGHIRGLMMNYEPATRPSLLRPLVEREMVMPTPPREIVVPGTTADLQRIKEKQRQELSYTIALFAGGSAGTMVDVTLFPVDTIKTRMQVSCQTAIRLSLDSHWRSPGQNAKGRRYTKAHVGPHRPRTLSLSRPT